MIDLRHLADTSLDWRVEGNFGLLLDKLTARWIPKEVQEPSEGEWEIDATEILCRLMDFKEVKKTNESARYPCRWRGVGNKEEALVKAQHRRLDALVATRGRARTYCTATSLAIGMGNSSALENGLTLHPTYGVPYIPGSAIKGMLAAWCEHWLDKVPDGFEQWFGRSVGGSDAQRIGGLTFLDALPCTPVKLVVDVMTPHAGPYYDDNPLPPADWHSPIPIPFIVVPKGQQFRLRFLVNGRSGFESTQALLDDVEGALEEALLTIGIGAKTAAGYGRLERL